jgi:predicted DsbA family dithiol-disulfide isomerase
LLFATVDQWTQGEGEAAFLSLADELALDREAFAACFNSRQALERVLADLYDAQGIIDSTPTFVAIASGRGTLLRGSLGDRFAGALQSLIEDAQAEN